MTGTNVSILSCLQFLPSFRNLIHHFFMYGREANLSLEVEKEKIDSKFNELVEVEQVINHLQSIRDEVFPVVVSNIDSSQKKQKDQYTRRKGLIQTTNIKEVDLVLLLNMLLSVQRRATKKRTPGRAHTKL